MRLPTLRRDGGFTVVEQAFASMIFLIVVSVVGAIMYAALHTSSFATSESQSVDEARLAAAQAQRDIRNAVAVSTCTPTGYCLRVLTQAPSGTLGYVQYRAVQATSSGPTTLYRDSGCVSDYSTCDVTRTLTKTLINHKNSQLAFQCVSTTTYPRIDVALLASPLSQQGTGALTIKTSARPRIVTVAFC